MPKKYFHIENMIINKGEIIDRVKKVAEARSDADLARFLSIAPATLSNWRSRGSIDFELVFSKCEHANLDWIITGRGRPELNGAQEQVAPVIIPTSEKEEMYKERIREDQKTIIELSQEIGQLRERIRQMQGVEKEAGTDTFGVFGGSASPLDAVDPEQSSLSDLPAQQKEPRGSVNK